MPGSMALLAVAGPLAVVGAWTLVRLGRASVWPVMAGVVGTLGALSLLTGEVRAATTLPPAVALVLGAGAGLALYLATAVFLAIVRGWEFLQRQVTELYGARGELSMPAAVLLSAGVVAVGEELLWRSLVLQAAVQLAGDLPGAALAWAAYVVVNAAAGNVPILLGAIVGGAAWTALAQGTGGVAASAACHAVWTALMVMLPPVEADGS